MIQLLLEATEGFEALSTTSEEPEQKSTALACWQSLLLLAVDKQSHVLIDTGALLAGVSNHEAAAFLVAQPSFAFQGVTYYDTRPHFDAWVVLEKDRDLIHHHKDASLRQSDTFVIFDEARASGSDMKLSSQAVALLTLGPNITKDKLMQGARRMRRLGKSQQTLWAHSGIQFYSKKTDPVHELQDDDWTLEGQYGAAQNPRLIADIIDSKLEKQRVLLNGRAAEETAILRQIQRHAHTFGRQDSVCVTNFDEECEREVQIEEEQVESREHTTHDVAPCVEKAWNWFSLFQAGSIDTLRAQTDLGIDIISLQDAAKTWFVPLECGEVAWEATKIFGTSNFWCTVILQVNSISTNIFVWTSCLRDVHAMIVFADGSILLLSEFEEHAVLEMLHTTCRNALCDDTARDDNKEVPNTTVQHMGAQRGCCGVVRLPFVIDTIQRMEASTTPTLRLTLREIPLAIGWYKGRVVVATRLVLPFISVVACCLLNGDKELFLGRHPAAAETALRTLLAPVRHREETLQSFINFRGFTGRWKRSSLHAMARRMDLEDAMGTSKTQRKSSRKK